MRSRHRTTSLRHLLEGILIDECQRELVPIDLAEWVTSRARSTLEQRHRGEERARQCLLDWMGVLLAARGLSVPVVPSPGILDSHGGEATDFLSMRQIGHDNAAFANAASAHVLDFDDCHNDLPGHASVTVIAAALSTAEHRDADWGTFFDGFIAGVEAAAQLGVLCGANQYARGWHPTATLGTVASAVASATVRGLSPTQVRSAVSLAAVRSSGALASFGTLGKSWQVGCAARDGVHAAAAAESGYEIEPDLLGATLGLMSEWADPQSSPDDDHQSPRINSTVFKYYAACFATHAAIDCAADFAIGLRMPDPGIERIQIRVGPQFERIISNRNPTSTLEAKFSISCVVAMTLLGSAPTSAEFFEDPICSTPAYRRLEELIEIVVDAGVQGTDATVTITLTNGETRRSSRAERAGSDIGDEWKALTNKFMVLAEPHLGERSAAEIVSYIRHTPLTARTRELRSLVERN